MDNIEAMKMTALEGLFKEPYPHMKRREVWILLSVPV